MNPPRSVLYVPASRERALDKLAALPADEFVIDLEDGVAAGDKETGRRRIRAALASGSLAPGGRFMLRINPPASAEHAADLALVAEGRPGRVVLPKAERVSDVANTAEKAAAAGAKLALVLETALGIGRARELAACHPALDMLILGSADLRRSLGASPDDGRDWERHALSELLLAARMCGASAIDSVYFRFRDTEGLKRHAAVARNLGYDGKSCIHPSQVGPIHDVYRSTEEEVAWARKVIAAVRGSARESGGVVVIGDEMIEGLHVPIAERILARA